MATEAFEELFKNQNKTRKPDSVSPESFQVSAGDSSTHIRPLLVHSDSRSQALSSTKSRFEDEERISFASSGLYSKVGVPKIRPALAWKTRNFMFPSQEKLAREKLYGEASPVKRSTFSVSFENLKELIVYNPRDKFLFPEVIFVSTSVSYKTLLQENHLENRQYRLNVKHQAEIYWESVVANKLANAKKRQKKKLKEKAQNPPKNTNAIEGGNQTPQYHRANRVVQAHLRIQKESLENEDENGLTQVLQQIEESVEDFSEEYRELKELFPYVFKLAKYIKLSQEQKLVKKLRYLSSCSLASQAAKNLERRMKELISLLKFFIGETLDKGLEVIREVDSLFGSDFHAHLKSLRSLPEKVVESLNGTIVVLAQQPGPKGSDIVPQLGPDGKPTEYQTSIKRRVNYVDFFTSAKIEHEWEVTLKYKRVKNDKWRKMVGTEPVELKPPSIILPSTFKTVGSFFKDPRKIWTFYKLSFADLYFTSINTMIVTAVLNENLHLLKHYQNLKPPTEIAAASFWAKLLQKEYGLRLVKNAQLTSNHGYHIARVDGQSDLHKKKLQLDPRKVTKAAYIRTGLTGEKSKGKKGETPALPAQISVDSLSGFLSPVVRADLYYSRRRGHCAATCRGHKGKLLLTAIRLRNFRSVRFLLENGMKVNVVSCGLNTKWHRWTMDTEALLRRRREAERAKMLAAGKPSSDLERIGDSQKKVDRVGLSKGTLNGVSSSPRAPNFRQPGVTSTDKAVSIRLVEDDLDRLLDYEYGTLVSKYEGVTPLSTAVELLIAEPCNNSVAIFNEVVNRIPKVQAADYVALRSCITFVGTLAKVSQNHQATLPRRQDTVKTKKKTYLPSFLRWQWWLTFSLRRLLHSSTRTNQGQNLTNSERKLKDDVVSTRNGEAPAMLKSNESVVRVDNSLTFVEDGTTVTPREIDLLRVFRETENPRKLLGFPDLQALRTIIKMTESHLNVNEKTSRKFNGNYANVYIRMLLVYEAIKFEKWRTVRFLVPAKEVRKRSRAMKDKVGQNSSNIDEIYVSYHFTRSTALKPINATVLNNTVELLLLSLTKMCETGTSSVAYIFKGLYFILQEYAVTFSDVQWEQLLRSLFLLGKKYVRLHAGEKVALEQLLRCEAFLVYLGIKKSTFYSKRGLNNLGLGRKQKVSNISRHTKSKNKFKGYKYYFPMFLAGLNVKAVVDIMEGIPELYATEKYLVETLKVVTAFRKQEEMVDPLLQLLKNVVSGSSSSIIGARCLELTIAAKRYTHMHETCDMILFLLRKGFTPRIGWIMEYIDRLIVFPPLGTEQEYMEARYMDSVVDLSPFLVFDRLLELLAAQSPLEVMRGFELMFLSWQQEMAAKLIAFSDLWLHGVQKIISFFEDFKGARLADSALYRLLPDAVANLEHLKNISFRYDENEHSFTKLVAETVADEGDDASYDSIDADDVPNNYVYTSQTSYINVPQPNTRLVEQENLSEVL
eukprot:augustus_masked-scaffold_5-processed-gene-3.32-mRNA-1 protein AED:1.00 eAED:1.00 QI:0/-1/0/0/-1/1/1/0/1460